MLIIYYLCILFVFTSSTTGLHISRGTKSHYRKYMADTYRADDFNRLKDFFMGRDDGLLDWYEMNGCSVIFPMNERVPKSIIHFIGLIQLEPQSQLYLSTQTRLIFYSVLHSYTYIYIL